MMSRRTNQSKSRYPLHCFIGSPDGPSDRQESGLISIAALILYSIHHCWRVDSEDIPPFGRFRLDHGEMLSKLRVNNFDSSRTLNCGGVVRGEKLFVID
jgi:hypothetical protein